MARFDMILKLDRSFLPSPAFKAGKMLLQQFNWFHIVGDIKHGASGERIRTLIF